MNISNFFIKRPIFAAVISIIIFVIGAIAYFRLPLSEYPEVVPPTVVVRTTYPGANPTVIADTVASPLEQQINGVEGMLYMFSQATADGVMTLTITFGLGTDLDKAQVQVQNRVSQALPRLPQEVQRLGVTTDKTSPDLLIADERLGAFNGLHLILRGRAEHPTMRAIVATAVKDPCVEAEASRMHALCLVKPLDPAEWLLPIMRTLEAGNIPQLASTP